MHDEACQNIVELVRARELTAAADLLVSLASGTGSTLSRDAVLIASSLADLARDEAAGVREPDEVRRERARIARTILEILDLVQKVPRVTPASRRRMDDGIVLPEDGRLEKIIGANNLKQVAWLARGLQAAKAVCRVVTPEHTGTGFLIRGNRIVTNHHVLANGQAAKRAQVEFNYQLDAANAPEPVSRYGLSDLEFWADPVLDLAIVRVVESNGAPSLASWGALERATRQPGRGDHVSIIQHPMGGPKQIAITANQVTGLFEHRVHYTTDTLPGSSGSPVFDDNWNVVAVHRAGGDLVVNGRGDRMFINEGVLLSVVPGAVW